MGATVAHGDETRARAAELYQVDGLGPKAISERLGVPHRTVASWRRRDGWGRDKAAVADALREAGRLTAKEIAERRMAEAEAAVGRTISDCGRLRALVLAPLMRGEGEIEVSETRQIVQSYRDLVSIERQAFGLDERAASTPATLVNISLGGATTGGPIGQGVAAQAIDVVAADSSDTEHGAERE